MIKKIIKHKYLILTLLIMGLVGYFYLVPQYKLEYYENPTVESEHIINDIYEFEWGSNLKQINSIDIVINKYDNSHENNNLKQVGENLNDPILNISIYDDDKLIDFYKYDYLTFDNNISSNKLSLQLSKIADSMWHSYKIKIKCDECTSNQNFVIGYKDYNEYGDAGPKSAIKISGYKRNYMPFIISALLLILSMSLCLKKINFNKFSFATKSIISFISTFLFAFTLLKSISLMYQYDIYSKVYIFSFFIFGIISLRCFFNNFNDKTIEKIFVAIVIPIGIFYMVFMPVGQVADETRHFYRAYGIADGNLLTPKKGNKIPKDLNYNIQRFGSYAQYFENIEIQGEKKGFEYVKDGADNYSPTLYIFSSLGIATGKLLNLNPYYCFYLGRIFNFIFFIISGYWIIKIVPKCKFLFMIYLLNPMMIHQGMSLSADVVLNSCALFYIAYVLYIKYVKKKLELRNILFISFLLFMIFLGKYVYSILILLLLLLKDEFMKIEKKDKIKTIILISLAIIFSLAYYFNFFNILNQSTAMTNEVKFKNLAIENIKSNPLNIINIFIDNLFVNGTKYIETFAGSRLAWLTIPTNNFFCYLYLVLLVFCMFDKEKTFEFDKKYKYLSIITILLITFALLFGFYISTNQPDLNIIVGVQGRYFLPYAILPLLFFANSKIKINKKLIIKLCIIINVVEIAYIFFHYLAV